LARSLPVDDELLGEALRQVIAHEVGHALGLPHNMIASSSYPTESLRDPEFAREMGVSASIMDYARQNYVAQPGDGLEGADFVRQIGPYDHYAIEWGYRIIPDATTPAGEKPVLDQWILAKADDPMYRFGNRSSIDPRSQTEDLGSDPVASAGYGLANLKRVAPRLVEWTSTAGEDYADLDELYGELLGQYSRYMGHVVTLIGGVRTDLKATDRAARRRLPGRPVSSQSGVVNTFSPHPVTNREFTDTLGEVLGRPTRFRGPKKVARIVLGEMADELLLASQRVRPTELLRTNFEFRQPELEAALRTILDRPLPDAPPAADATRPRA
jgi:hypothetical protein